MSDTTIEAEEIWHEMWKQRSPQERVKIASAMFVSARKTIVATMPENLSETEQKRYIYERTYGESLPCDFFSGSVE